MPRGTQTHPPRETRVLTRSLTHIGDQELLNGLAALAACDRKLTAVMLAHIAEVEARRLYVPAGYASMHAYCVGQLKFSEEVAYKRIQAARAVRQFPEILDALVDGRLNLRTVVLLRPYLTRGGAAALLSEAEHCSRFEVEQLIARRFPESELLPLIEALPGTHGNVDDGAVHVEDTPMVEPAGSNGRPENGGPVVGDGGVQTRLSASSRPPQLDPDPVRVKAQTDRVIPIADKRLALHMTMSEETHGKLRHAQNLLSHAVPDGDMAQVLDRALDALIEKLEKRKFARLTRRRGDA